MFKRRKFRIFKENKFNFGTIALIILRPLRLNSQQIFRYKLFLKKSSKRSDKTGRKSWLNIFPHLPLTRKVAGSRMGKGKGKLDGWFSDIPSGINIIEFKNLRYGRSVYFFKQLMHRIPTKCKINFKNKKNKIRITLSKSINVNYDAFW